MSYTSDKEILDKPVVINQLFEQRKYTQKSIDNSVR